DLNFNRNEYQPEGGEGYRSSMLYFIRGLKSHPAMRKMFAYQALTEVQMWMERRRVSWSDFPNTEGDDEGIAEFLDSWDKIRHGLGSDSITQAKEMADVRPVEFEFEGPITEGFQRFVGVLFWLQKAAGDKSIFLPTRKLSKELKKDPKTISRWKQL